MYNGNETSPVPRLPAESDRESDREREERERRVRERERERERGQGRSSETDTQTVMWEGAKKGQTGRKRDSEGEGGERVGIIRN